MKLHTPSILKAMNIANLAHLDQVDDCGAPYIFHPAYIASQMDTEEEIIVALLHDVIRKCHPMYHQDIHTNFSTKICETIEILNQYTGVSYENYMLRIITNSVARKVKLAELRHDTDLTRHFDRTMTASAIKQGFRMEKWIHILDVTPDRGYGVINKTEIGTEKLQSILAALLPASYTKAFIAFPTEEGEAEVYFQDGRKALLVRKEPERENTQIVSDGEYYYGIRWWEGVNNRFSPNYMQYDGIPNKPLYEKKDREEEADV